jgi:hypothetical protein
MSSPTKDNFVWVLVTSGAFTGLFAPFLAAAALYFQHPNEPPPNFSALYGWSWFIAFPLAFILGLVGSFFLAIFARPVPRTRTVFAAKGAAAGAVPGFFFAMLLSAFGGPADFFLLAFVIATVTGAVYASLFKSLFDESDDC